MRGWKAAIALGLLVGAAGCSSGGGGTKKQPPVEVVLTAEPPAGTYAAYQLGVTITADDARTELFFDIGKDPVVDDAKAYRGNFTVRLVSSASIRVRARDPEGNLWGPYAFEYRLTRRFPYGACELSPLNRTYFKPTEKVPVTISYNIASALSTVEIVVDGKGVPLEIDPSAAQGAQVVDIGPVTAEGDHTLGCRVTSAQNEAAGNELAFVVDGTKPVIAWVTGGGAYRRDTWVGSLTADVADARSGLAEVRVCKGADCIPLTHVLGDRYVYATVPTTGADAVAALHIEAVDHAGNLAVSAAQTIDLSSFPESDAPAPGAITLTTDSSVDLATLVGATPAEIRTFNWALVGSSVVSLAPGFNDFLVRRPGATVWESASIYRAGAKVTLPASAWPWLVYAGNATVPAFEARRIDVVAANPGAGVDWVRPLFDVPHLWFVQDRDNSGAWSTGDALYVVAGDAYDGPWYVRGAPVVVGAAASPFTLGSTPQAVQVDCAAGCTTPGTLVFERRGDLAALPVTHDTLLVATLPYAATVTVTPGELGVWYWDTDGDGILGAGEPRAWADVSAAAVTLDTADPRAFDYFQGSFVGLDYGGMVTGVVTLEAGGTPVQRLPAASFRDSGGVGVVSAQGQVLVPLLGVAGRFDFWSGGQTVGFTFSPFADSTVYPVHIALDVTDETGAGVAALVAQTADALTARPTDASGSISYGVASLAQPVSLIAARDGYLGVAADVTQTTASLRLLSPAVTSWLQGYVQDGLGQPVANVTVRWTAGDYRAQTITRDDGWYAMPVSGGDGVLLVERSGEYLVNQTFEVSATAATNFFIAVVSAVPDEPWPLGLATYGAVSRIEAPVPVTTFANNYYYGLAGTDAGEVAVAWSSLERRVTLPGALPAVTTSSPAAFATSWYSTLLPTRVECGAWFQEIYGAASAQAPCWSWVGDDGFQKFIFGPLRTDTGFPPYVGMGDYYAYVVQGGVSAADQTLVFHERLLGQTLRVPVRGGLAAAALPYGLYEVETAGGAPVYLAGTTATRFSFTAPQPTAMTLEIP